MTDPSGDEWLGRAIAGRFAISRVLGKGGMGAVYAARDGSSGAEVAVKVLLPELAREGQHLARFRREAEVMGMLDHPHVVRALATGVEGDGAAWLAMELAEGETLSAFMRRRGSPLGVPEAVAIARQIVAALSAAHEVGIVHRDLKPANVMLTHDERGVRVKVLDFGLARFIDSPTYQRLTMTGFVVGTPSYMPPEQVFGDGVDHRADLYAVGAILHALLTGAPPFGSGKGTDILPRLIANDRPRLTETRRDLGPIVEVVERLLEPEPEQRYASAAELDAALAPFDAKTPSTREWVRPPTMHSLVLPPDPVLDAPRPRKRPRTIMTTMPARATPAATRGPPKAAEARSGGQRALLVLAALLAMAVSATAVVVGLDFATDDRDLPADVGPTPNVTPVALGAEATADAAATDPATVEAPETDVDLESPPVVRRREDGRGTGATPAPAATFPTPAGLSVHIELLEDHGSDRVVDEIRRTMSSLRRCLVEMPSVPAPPPYTWNVDYALDGLEVRLHHDAPSGFESCTHVWMNELWIFDAPAGAAHIRFRVHFREAPAGSQELTLDDRRRAVRTTSTPASPEPPPNEAAPVAVRLVFTIEHSDVANPETIRQRLGMRTSQFRQCVSRLPELPRGRMYTGTATFRMGNAVQSHADFAVDVPGAIRTCIAQYVVAGFAPPLPPNGELRMRFTAVAADETTIVVRGP